MTIFDQLTQQQYINLETFRKSGVGVNTPVWFVQDGDIIYVRTVANSGKVKRIRNNAQVNIAPCEADGALLGEWVPALARELKDGETDRKVNRLLDKKYGLVKKMFGLVSALQGRKDTILEIKQRTI
jgi:PPOX class probable F420-dependent enzyme